MSTLKHQGTGVGFSIVTSRVTTEGFDVRNIQTWTQWSAANVAYQNKIKVLFENAGFVSSSSDQEPKRKKRKTTSGGSSGM